MATINEKFQQMGEAIINLIGTRASRNLDNLSAVGKANIQLLNEGISKDVVGNVCITLHDAQYTGTNYQDLQITGKFSGVIPAGKNAVGSPCHTTVADIEANGTVDVPATSLGYKLTLFIDLDGTIQARRYTASYTEPDVYTDTIWYDLNNNFLKVYEDDQWVQTACFQIGELNLNGEEIKSIIFDMGYQLLDAGTITRALNIGAVPTGSVVAFMGNEIPAGFLLMDGRYLSKTIYGALYNVIGDSQTTTPREGFFQIADTTDGRYLMGSTTPGVLVAAGLPNVTGTIGVSQCLSGSGALYGSESGLNWMPNGRLNYANINLNLQRANGIYGNSSTVTPKSIRTRWIIKY